MIDEWRTAMDSLSDVYYLTQIIIGQILIFLKDFIFHEFSWFAPVEEDFDNTNPKILNIVSQHAIADFLMLFTMYGLLFAFMILSSKNKASNYNPTNSETFPTIFEEKPFSHSKSSNSKFINYSHVSSDAICTRRDIIPKTQKIPSLTILKRSEIRNYNVDLNSQYSRNMQRNRITFQTPREWLVRHTRSGQVYGKYPI